MIDLPGHEFSLHVLFSFVSPEHKEDFLEGEILRFLEGEILRERTPHNLFLSCSPPPQLFEQVDQSSQSDHSKRRNSLTYFEMEVAKYLGKKWASVIPI